MGYGYHATTARNLRSIVCEGLSPAIQPVCHADEERCIDEPVVFFSPTESHASVWGPRVVRFPLPAEYYDDDYSDTTMLPDGTITATNLYTLDPIPPEQIEVRRGKTWVPARQLCKRRRRS